MLVFTLVSSFIVAQSAPPQTPVGLCPTNPHYFQFRGRPTLLIGSGEHYGAVLNLDFDQPTYLDAIAAAGLNQTRTFSGTYREVPGSFNIRNNTLAPQPGRYRSPWVRVSKDGEPEKFDLSKLDPAYFERLKGFVREASRRGIVVELVLFCPFYEESLWEVNPMNPRNNTQGWAPFPREEAYTLKHPELLEVQLAFVHEAVRQLADFDNVYFEICNEPYFGGVTMDWQHRVADAIVEAEKGNRYPHLIAQNIANDHAKIEHPHPAVGLFNFHYANPPAALENLALNKALGDDETGFEGTGDRPYREEAWLFLLSGGGLFSHLDYSFTTDHEDGTAPVEDPTPGGGGVEFRKQLKFLRDFLERYDFTKMQPEPALLKGVPEGVKHAVLAETGKQYAVYLSGGGGSEVTLDLPGGVYRADWFDPRTGANLGGSRLEAGQGGTKLRVPPAPEDVALRVLPIGIRQHAEAPRLKVHESGRFLQYEDGRPFFYLADTAWEFFHRLDLEEARRYLDDRAGKGFTVIQAVVLAELDGLGTPNSMGQSPLENNDPTKPNEEYFRHVDRLVELAAERGLYIGMLPTWGDKVNRKWGIGPEVFTPENARVYGEFLGRRYERAPILWILGGDRPVENDRHRAIWIAMAEGLRQGDSGAHLMTYHPMGEQSSADYFPDAPWLDFHMIQSGHRARDLPNFETIAREYARTPAKPVVDGEPRYEDHPINWKPDNGWFDDLDVRKALYWSVLAGGAGVTYGNHDIWQMWQPGRAPISSARTPWHAALRQPGSSQAGHLRRLIESRPYFTRVPDQSLVPDGGSGGEHVQACRDSEGRYAIIYLPTANPVTVDLSKLKGETLVAWWFDPRTGRAIEAERFTRPNGPRAFTPPARGPDWVIVLDDDAAGFGPPGTEQ